MRINLYIIYIYMSTFASEMNHAWNDEKVPHQKVTSQLGWRFFTACGLERNVHWWRYDFDTWLLGARRLGR